MMPTDGPYMLKDTFPQLLDGASAPEHEKVWELSRFAIETEGDNSFGFAERAMEAMRGIVNFADEHGIQKYVTVTTPAIERLLRHAGVEIVRMGPILRIGVERAVALEIRLGQQTRTALFGNLH
jgi:acyl homoserine lactone synthase